MSRWGRGDWLYAVKKYRGLDSSFSDVDPDVLKILVTFIFGLTVA